MEMWFNPGCSKCRMAKEMLDEAGSDYVVRRYLDEPPSVDDLSRVLDALGLEPWDITRLGEPIAESLGLASWPRDRARWLAALASHPVLIQRPIIVTSDGSAWIARDADSVQAAIDAAADVGSPASSGQVD